MKDKIIIELELLAPLKYEKMFLKDGVSQPIVHKVTKPHMFNKMLTNIDLYATSIKPERIERQEDDKEFERIYYMKGYDRKRESEIYEFKGLLPEEFKNQCNFYYKVLNFPDKGLDVIRTINATYKCFVKPTHLDKETIETFGDLFAEL